MEASVIRHTYFLQALSKVRPSLTAQQISAYQTPPTWQTTYDHVLCIDKLQCCTKFWNKTRKKKLLLVPGIFFKWFYYQSQALKTVSNLRSALRRIHEQSTFSFTCGHRRVLHTQNVLIISNVDQLTDWNPLVHFKTGSSLCVRTCSVPRTLFSSCLHHRGSQDVLRHLKDFAATTGETCHWQLPPWLAGFIHSTASRTHFEVDLWSFSL